MLSMKLVRPNLTGLGLATSSFSFDTSVLVAQNKGPTTHALEITGPGLEHAETPSPRSPAPRRWA